MTETKNELDILNELTHELKTPLAATKSFIELAQVAGELNEKQAHFLLRARQSLLRMESMISMVLDHARLGKDMSLNRQPCDLQMMVDNNIELLESLADTKNIMFEVDIPDDACAVSADPNLLNQVISNLLSNAIKYNREGGTVSIQTQLEDDAIYITISDTGIGIPPEAQPHVWDSFYRVEDKAHQKVDGTGLGLSIVKTVIERHDGHIEMTSVEGEGTSFSFMLPCADAVMDEGER